MRTFGQANDVLRRAIKFAQSTEGDLAATCRVLTEATFSTMRRESHIHGDRQAVLNFRDDEKLGSESREQVCRLLAWLEAPTLD